MSELQLQSNESQLASVDVCSDFSVGDRGMHRIAEDIRHSGGFI